LLNEDNEAIKTDFDKALSCAEVLKIENQNLKKEKIQISSENDQLKL
jgi:hypothetical protein